MGRTMTQPTDKPTPDLFAEMAKWCPCYLLGGEEASDCKVIHCACRFLALNATGGDFPKDGNACGSKFHTALEAIAGRMGTITLDGSGEITLVDGKLGAACKGKCR